MPKLDLTRAHRIKNSQGTFAALKASGVSWASAPFPAAPIDSVVFIGASHEEFMFGNNYLTSPQGTATNHLKTLGHALPVYGHAKGGTRVNVAAQYYSEARAAYPNALIVMQFGGNDVTAVRPYPGGEDTIKAGLAALLTVAKGDPNFYPASLTFRDYDDLTFQDPSRGSKPYNENIFLPWIAANFPHAMGAGGRPKIDNYRIVLQNFDAWLQADNIHMTGAGNDAFRKWYVERVADILNGVVPAEIPERVYVPPSPQAPAVTKAASVSGGTTVGSVLTADPGTASGNPAATPAYQWDLDGTILTGETGKTYTRPATVGAVPGVTVTWSNGVEPAATSRATAAASTAVVVAPEPEPGAPYPLSIINFTGETYTATYRVPHNEVFGNIVTVNPNPIPQIVDVNNNPTGMALSVAYTGNPTISASAPGRGSNQNGITTGLPSYAGQLMSKEVVAGNAYVTNGVTMVMDLSGMVPGASYEFGMVGSRGGVADARYTTLTIGGVATTWNTTEATPIERKVTVPADANGKMRIVLATQAGSTFAYLNGLSIQRVP